MTGWRKHPLRVGARLLWLGLELSRIGLRYRRVCRGRSGPDLALARARWLQDASRRLLRIFDARVRHVGTVPQHGLLVANHLSYIDIMVLASLAPAVFVSKREVQDWPVFGWFARRAGTVFVERERRSQAGQAGGEIEAALRDRLLVVLFPEGTSSNGKAILPFKSALLEPAVRHPHAITAAFLRYELDDGDPGQDICFWGDMTMVPHVLNLLSKACVRVEVRFTPVHAETRNRKHLARQLHSEVSRLRQGEESRQLPASEPSRV